MIPGEPKRGADTSDNARSTASPPSLPRRVSPCRAEPAGGRTPTSQTTSSRDPPRRPGSSPALGRPAVVECRSRDAAPNAESVHHPMLVVSAIHCAIVSPSRDDPDDDRSEEHRQKERSGNGQGVHHPTHEARVPWARRPDARPRPASAGRHGSGTSRCRDRRTPRRWRTPWSGRSSP